MNTLGAVLLTSSPWTQGQWLAFKQYIESIGLASCTVFWVPVNPIPVTISINIAAMPNATLAALQTMALNVVNNYFALSNQSLGWSLAPTDLSTQIIAQSTYLLAPGESGALVDYVTVNLPQAIISAPITGYLTLAGAPTPVINVQYTTRGQNAASTGQIIGLGFGPALGWLAAAAVMGHVLVNMIC